MVVIDEILVARAQTEDPLPEHLQDGVLDPSRVAVIAEAACEASEQTDAPVGPLEQQHTCVARHRAGVEARHSRAPRDARKEGPLRATVCRHRVVGPVWCKYVVVQALRQSTARSDSRLVNDRG